MMNELKKCPFCGQDGELRVLTRQQRYKEGHAPAEHIDGSFDHEETVKVRQVVRHRVVDAFVKREVYNIYEYQARCSNTACIARNSVKRWNSGEEAREAWNRRA